MNSTLKEQIEAIQTVRILIAKIADTISLRNPKLDSILNDAGSTIAALNLSPKPESSGNRNEYFDQLVNAVCTYLEDRPENEPKHKQRILEITFDSVIELKARIEELEKELDKANDIILRHFKGN